jgi:hypothetical protein
VKCESVQVRTVDELGEPSARRRGISDSWDLVTQAHDEVGCLRVTDEQPHSCAVLSLTKAQTSLPSSRLGYESARQADGLGDAPFILCRRHPATGASVARADGHADQPGRSVG